MFRAVYAKKKRKKKRGGDNIGSCPHVQVCAISKDVNHYQFKYRIILTSLFIQNNYNPTCQDKNSSRLLKNNCLIGKIVFMHRKYKI